tara:strand:- start:347 stop:718 length:372 start_codon:yes stop_codon:yes gene_type:complete
MTTIYITEQEIKLAIDKCDRRIGNINREEQRLGMDLCSSICISVIKTEKLIYTSILNPNTKKEIFKLLLAKFDELVNNTYDISGDMVREEKWEEGVYIDYCKESLDYRKYIYKMCCYGYGKKL